MNYQELKKIVQKRITYDTISIPQDAFSVASQVNVRVKNSIECKQECQGQYYPLTNKNACYDLYYGEATIYYNEKYPYKNFAVAHEIAHHLLGHTSEGLDQHLDAQLMTAIIVAPSEYIHGIKSAQELAQKCKIPINVAEDYWYELEEAGEIEGIAGNRRIFSTLKIAPTTVISISVIAVLLAIISFMGLQQASLNRSTTEAIQSTETTSVHNMTAPVYSDALDLDTVYVTPTGKKFHYIDCRHLKGADHIFEMTGYEAIETGYEPCKDCIR